MGVRGVGNRFLGDGRKNRMALGGGGFDNWNGRNVDPECTDGEESENGFGEHDDGECRKREQITAAPGLRLERLEKGAGRAAQRLRKPGSAHQTFYTSLKAAGCRYGSNVFSSFSAQPFGYKNGHRIFSLSLVASLPSKARERRSSFSYANRYTVVTAQGAIPRPRLCDLIVSSNREFPEELDI